MAVFCSGRFFSAFALKVSDNTLAGDRIFRAGVAIVDPQANFLEGKLHALLSEEGKGEVAVRELLTAGRNRLKLVSGGGQVQEVSRDQVSQLGRIRWTFQKH